MHHPDNAPVATLAAALGSLTPGNHLCLIGEDEAEPLVAAMLFVRLGLERGEQCIYVADEDATTSVLDALIGGNIDVASALEARQLVLITPQAAYLQGDALDAYRMFTFWKRAGEAAARDGFAALRCLGDTGSLLAEARDTQRWMAYESRLTQLGQDANCIFLCQYRRKRVPAELMPEIIRSHPVVVYRGSVCENIYHARQEELSAGEVSARDTERLLDTLWQHQQSVDVLRRRREELSCAEQALRQTQAELARISRMMTLGELTASVAHEVAQPLASMITDTAAALRWLTGQARPDLDEVRQALERVAASGRRARAVIEWIRSMVNKTGGNVERLDVNAVIAEVISLTSDKLKRNCIALRTQLDGALPPASADRVQVQQVLLNLIINALEAINMRADGTGEVVIRTYRDGPDWIHIAVRDSGVGLGPGDPQGLFDSFYTTKPGGMGMGLSISRTIVQAHGGKLWAVRNEPEPGATFHCTLPVWDEDA